MEIDFAVIEKKWQERWEKERVFEVRDNGAGPYYVLEMFAYPSGEGLHMGHAFNFVIGDVFARYKIMNGFNVLHPVGYDALGLPAENAAIKAGTHPADYTNTNILNFMKQQKGLGLSYDWSRMVNTADASYYKWDQWIFLKMLEKGLAYQKVSAVNWCSKCRTVLANEQVKDGKCWRHGDCDVEVRNLKQWFLKTAEYADELYSGLDKLSGWPEKTRAMQRNWIGKSHGTEIDFLVEGKKWKIFTTRSDTIFGVTFMVVSAQHPKLDELVTAGQRKEVDKFLSPRDDSGEPNKIGSVSQKSMKDVGDLEKEGVFSGSYAVNPANGEKVPIWIGNFVVADYGCGMVMAVPAHDQRDFEFAKKYGIEIKPVVIPVLGEYKKYKDVDKMFDIVKEVYNEFEKNKIKIWFNGTFGVIGYYKKIFVKPNDVDCGVLEKDFEKSKKIVLELGYKKINEKDYGEFRVASFEKNDISFQLGTFDKDLGDNIAEVNDINYRIPDAGWLSNCYEITSKKERRAEMNDFERAKFLEIVSGNFPEAFTGAGKLINSGEFDGLDSVEAKEKISSRLEKKGVGRKVVNFKLRDWGISRQRYWGTPIPVVHCEGCGVVAVPEKDLPVKLPRDVKFGKGNPLESAEDWLNVKCPKCGGKARREGDTMDTFVNSSWYFMRFCDAHNDKKIFDKDKVKHWCPVDFYVGGAEHACMHLIYSRFYVKFLRDLGLVDFDEPAVRLFHQGMINDEKGEKMSKSKGNVVEPLETMAKYGVDTTRYFLLSMASPDKGFNWSDKEIVGSQRFVRKVVEFFEKCEIKDMGNGLEDSLEVLSRVNVAIKGVGEDIENMELRAATIKLKELFNFLAKEERVSIETRKKALKLLVPFCPHICEEIWEKLGNKKFISVAEWPKAKLGIRSKVLGVRDINDKIVEDVRNVLTKVDGERVYVYVMPFEIGKIDVGKISKEVGKDVEAFAVNDSGKYDPKGKARKAKPGKVSIYVE